MTFRDDINGLRAIAVTTVLLFHFRVSWASGGFVGVDVFFVISGYLMTRIVADRLESGRFSLLAFYRDRARRIVPALTGVVGAVLAFGFVAVDPLVYEQIGQDALAALTYVSNIVFYRQAGYFDAQSEQKWLLHTWSLSVEWQFYLIYPVVLRWVAGPRLRPRLIGIVWLGFAGSFALCVVATDRFPQASFYLLPTRAWELLAGGLVHLHAARLHLPPLARTGLSTTGIAVIAASVVFLDASIPWPSYWAILPVAATCAILVARPERPLWACNPVSATLGRWSYAIYLWHWPIVVAFGYLGWSRNPLVLTGVLGAVLFGGAFAIRLIAHGREVAGSTRTWSGWRAGAAAYGAAAVFAAIIAVSHGAPQRAADRAGLFAEYRAASRDWVYPAACEGLDRAGHLRPCRIGDTAASGGTVVIGDSHAAMLQARYAGRETGPPLVFLATNGCAPIPDVDQVARSRRCPAFIDEALKSAGTFRFARVVLVSMWANYFPPPEASSAFDLDRTCFVEGDRCVVPTGRAAFLAAADQAFERLAGRLSALVRDGAEVTLVLPFPGLHEDILMALSKRTFRGQPVDDLASVATAEFREETAFVRSKLKAVAARAGARLLDPVDHLCGPSSCPATGEDGHPLYFDANHFRASVVRGERFRFLDEVLGRSAE